MSADELRRIEARFHARLPRAYKQLAARGALTRGSPNYLALLDVRWLPPAEIPGHDLCPYAPHLPGLIPLATTGGGDHWCLHTGRTFGGGRELPVLLCPHDDEQAEWQAPTFLGWLYRRGLESATWIHESDPAAAELRADLARLATMLDEFALGAWAADLRQVAARPMTEDPSGAMLIADAEVAQRMEQTFGGEFATGTIRWMGDEADDAANAARHRAFANQVRRDHWAREATNPRHHQGPPCPRCNQPLRTARARQCFHCGAKWHD